MAELDDSVHDLWTTCYGVKISSPIPVLYLNPIFLASSIWFSIKSGNFDECILSYAIGVDVYLDVVPIHPWLGRTLVRYDLQYSFTKYFP